METTITNTTPAAIALDNLLAVIFPPTGLLRLVGANGNQGFHRRIAGRWLLLGQERARARCAVRGALKRRSERTSLKSSSCCCCFSLFSLDSSSCSSRLSLMSYHLVRA